MCCCFFVCGLYIGFSFIIDIFYFYVSCNSATQARDLALMDEKYKVARVRPVDMFVKNGLKKSKVLKVS